MADKQVFAKFAIFLLLGVNVAAYYYFWPHHENGVKSAPQGPREEKGQATLLPEKKDDAKPKELSAITLVDAIPLSIPNSPAPPKKDVPEGEALVKLLDHIEREKDEVKNLLPAFPPLPGEKPLPLPLPLPPIPNNPLNPEIGITSPLTPKQPTKGWIWKTEIVGAQTLLTTSLEGSKQAVELRILCDKVETKVGEVIALGNVSVEGADLRVKCGRLVLSASEQRVVFEEQVVVARPPGLGLLRGERFVWEHVPGEPKASGNPGVLGPPN